MSSNSTTPSVICERRKFDTKSLWNHLWRKLNNGRVYRLRFIKKRDFCLLALAFIYGWWQQTMCNVKGNIFWIRIKLIGNKYGIQLFKYWFWFKAKSRKGCRWQFKLTLRNSKNNVSLLVWLYIFCGFSH